MRSNVMRLIAALLWLSLLTTHADRRRMLEARRTNTSTAGYSANAVTYAGDGQCYMERDSEIGTDSTGFTVNLWVNFAGGDGATQTFFANNGRVSVLKTAGNNIRVNMYNQAGVQAFQIDQTTVASITASQGGWDGDGWFHIMASGTTTTGAGHLYINGTNAASLTVAISDSTLIENTRFDWAVGGDIGGGQALNGCVAELAYWETYLDLSNSANRDKLVNSTTKAPVSLGSDGSTPTGTQPLFYFKGAFDAYTVNSGSGGNFTKYGTSAFTSCTAP